MSKKLDSKLERMLDKIESVRFEYKNERRIRMDVGSGSLPTLLELLQGHGGYIHLSAITCVDWIDDNEFELVYHVWSYERKSLISAHTRILREPGIYLSIYDLYHPAGFFERDIHEMYGVYFEGSPDMEKFILTEWDGPPPMRKDFDSEGFVNEHFQWEQYHPQWLKDLEAEGGGITTRPEDIR